VSALRTETGPAITKLLTSLIPDHSLKNKLEICDEIVRQVNAVSKRRLDRIKDKWQAIMLKWKSPHLASPHQEVNLESPNRAARVETLLVSTLTTPLPTGNSIRAAIVPIRAGTAGRSLLPPIGVLIRSAQGSEYHQKNYFYITTFILVHILQTLLPNSLILCFRLL
jgi:hypothetical protein